MSNNSYDESIEDQSKRSIRDIKAQNNSQLFKSNHQVVKIQEEDIDISENIGNISGFQCKNKYKNAKNNSFKNKTYYQDKITNLVSQQEIQKRSVYKYGDYFQNRGDKKPITPEQKLKRITKQQKLKRNRQSAKHCRQRRKQYTQILQEKNFQNQKIIQQLTKKLRQAQIERDCLKDENRSYMKTFVRAKNEAYKNLNDILLKNGNRPSDKLSQELGILIARYGAAGSERIATTDYYIKQIIQILLADIHKYIMGCVVNDSGLFGLGQWTKMDDLICEALKVNKQIRVKLNRTYKNTMIQEFQTFKALSQKFYDSYRGVQNQAKIIQKIFQKISLQFNDACIAQLLLWLEQIKFSKQIKSVRAWWARSVQQPQQPQQPMRNQQKMSKFQSMKPQ